MADPAGLAFLGELVEAAGDIGRGLLGLLGLGEDLAVEGAGDRHLLDHAPVVAPVEAVEDMDDGPRLLDDLGKVGAGAVVAGGEMEDGVLDAGGDEVILERALVLEVELGGAALQLVERRLGDEDVPALDQRRASGGRRR